MGRRKKKKVDPLARFHKTAQTLLDTGEFPYGNYAFKLKELKRNNTTGTYECHLTKDNEKTVYGHVKEAKTKLEAISCSLEGLEMMGYGELSDESSEEKPESSEEMVNPLTVKQKRKPRKTKLALQTRSP